MPTFCLSGYWRANERTIIWWKLYPIKCESVDVRSVIRPQNMLPWMLSVSISYLICHVSRNFRSLGRYDGKIFVSLQNVCESINVFTTASVLIQSSSHEGNVLKVVFTAKAIYWFTCPVHFQFRNLAILPLAFFDASLLTWIRTCSKLDRLSRPRKSKQVWPVRLGRRIQPLKIQQQSEMQQQRRERSQNVLYK
jgi:hypothetical protein